MRSEESKRQRDGYPLTADAHSPFDKRGRKGDFLIEGKRGKKTPDETVRSQYGKVIDTTCYD
ncbi:MAG: hypothetical protein CO149_01210, partial [Nitrospirae bacterium CG_4_9_14_3_um_filter_51_5]